MSQMWLSARFAVALGNALSQTSSVENTVLKAYPLALLALACQCIGSQCPCNKNRSVTELLIPPYISWPHRMKRWKRRMVRCIRQRVVVSMLLRYLPGNLTTRSSPRRMAQPILRVSLTNTVMPIRPCVGVRLAEMGRSLQIFYYMCDLGVMSPPSLHDISA